VTSQPYQLCANGDGFLGSFGRQCQPSQFCADAGYTDDPLIFDSFGSALMSVIVCISGEGDVFFIIVYFFFLCIYTCTHI
jgi:hypothetical protein